MLGLAHMERKVSQDFLELRVVLATLVSPALAMLEHLAFAGNPVTLAYLDCQDNQVYLDQEVSTARMNPNSGHKGKGGCGMNEHDFWVVERKYVCTWMSCDILHHSVNPIPVHPP